MAGLEHYKMTMDPAILKLNNMTTNRYKYFRWTPRTAKVTFMFVGVVPTLFGILAYSTEGKWNLRAKRRGDVLTEY